MLPLAPARLLRCFPSLLGCMFRGRESRLRRQRAEFKVAAIERLEDRTLLAVTNIANVLVEAEIVEDGEFSTIIFEGTASIDQSETLGDPDMDGRQQVDTEIVSLSLTGFDPEFLGPMQVTLSGAVRSTGEIEEFFNQDTGNLEFRASSFFDLFFLFNGELIDEQNPLDPPMPVQLHNNDPARIEATISAGPTGANDTFVMDTPIPLFDPAENPTGVTLESLRVTFDANVSSISGQKWDDLNGDGVHDPDEPGLDGWVVVLLERFSGRVVDAQVTRSIDLNDDMSIDPITEQGRYSFGDLEENDYFVTELLQAGWEQTFPGRLPPLNLPAAGPGPDWISTIVTGDEFVAVGVLADLDWDLDGMVDETVFLEGNTGILVGNAFESVPASGNFDSVVAEIVSFNLFGLSSMGPISVNGGDFNANLANDGSLHSPGLFTQSPGDPALVDNFFDIFFEMNVGAVDGLGGTDLHNSTAVRVEGVVDRFPVFGIPFDSAGPVTLLDDAENPFATLSRLRFAPFDFDALRDTAGYTVSLGLGQDFDGVDFGNHDRGGESFGTDFGDAPVGNYPTLLADNGARHDLNGRHFLGNYIDPELDGQPHPQAIGDDIAFSPFGLAQDDEDGVFFESVLTEGLPADLRVLASNRGFLNAWIDFNGDGDWDEPNEQIFTNQLLAPGTNNLSTAPIPVGAAVGPTFARFRFNSSGGLSFNGPASDGEVEDYIVQITDTEIPDTDYGDAPDPTYPTLSTSNGAFHTINGRTFLGNFVDGEEDGQPSIAADGDDTVDALDEDGVTFLRSLQADRTGDVQVRTSDFGFLNGWIDFNGDGDWDEANEQILNDVPLGPGLSIQTFGIPGVAAGTQLGDTYARFRFSDQSGMANTPVGFGGNGEVEDYRVRILHPELEIEVGDWELAVSPNTIPSSDDQVGLNFWGIFGDDEDDSIDEEDLTQVFQQWFWYRVGDSGPEQQLDSLALTNATAGGNQIDLSYGSAADGDAFTVDLTYVLAAPSADDSSITETINITNLTGGALDLHWFAYSDLDLNGSFGAVDTANLVAPGQILQSGGLLSSIDVQVISGPLPDAHEIGLGGAIISRLNDGDTDDLTSTPAQGVNVGPGDVTHAFQWDLNLAANGQAGDSVMIAMVKDGDFFEVVLPGGGGDGGVVIGGNPNAGGGAGGPGGSSDPVGGVDGAGGGSDGSIDFDGDDAPININRPRFFDPALAVGYDFIDTGGNPFASITAPSGFGDNNFTLMFPNGNGTATQAITGGVPFDFTSVVPGGVPSFRLIGIETSPLDAQIPVDAKNPAGFPTGLTFVNMGPFEFTQTAIPETIYVDQSTDFLEEQDHGGMVGVVEVGDVVTWRPGATEEITGLVFGVTAFGAIQPAVDAVNHDGTSILIGPGTFNESVTVNKAITGITGSTAGPTIVNGSARVFDFTKDGITIVSNLTIQGGSANGGAGIRNASDLDLVNVTVTNNTSTGDGGGIYNSGQLDITNSTISGNTAASGGGGIYNYGGDLTITNSTISGNTANNGGGGGIYVNGGTVTISNSTISGNTTDSGGGGISNDSTTTTSIKNTIIANNIDTSGNVPDLEGAFASMDHNLIEDVTGATFTGTTTNNITGVDPVLGPLANNGGPTQTHALLAGSPAIDAANNAGGPNSDQRGFPRPTDTTADIGAFEAAPPLTVSILADAISENGGATTATVTRPDTNGELTVNLLSDDTSEATVVSSVMIPDGQATSAAFAISGVDDALLDGTQTVTITASAIGYSDGIDIISITDDETRAALDLRLVRMPTPASNEGEVAVLPANAEFLDEWEGFAAEIFVSTPDLNNVGISDVSVDLTYDTQFFTAITVDFADAAFANNQNAQINDPGGRVTGISASTINSDVGDDGFALLARVFFQSLGNDNVLLQTDDQHVQPITNLGFGFENATASAVGIGVITAQSGPIPETVLRPVVYDLNDDGAIDFGDFSVFSGVFRSEVEIGSPSEAFAADFNFDNKIDFGDFSLFAANFRQTRESSGQRVFSDDFPTSANNLRLGSLSSPGTTEPALANSQLTPIAVEAISRIEDAHGDEIAADLQAVTFEISDLPNDLLAQTRTNVIVIDTDAAGHGWFIDATPATDFEFAIAANSFELTTTSSGPAADRVDLLTVLMHELGHWLGLQHSDRNTDLMNDSLPLGVRRVPNTAFTELSGQEFDSRELDSVFSNFLDSEELLRV